jgi:hypothetical protein
MRHQVPVSRSLSSLQHGGRISAEMQPRNRLLSQIYDCRHVQASERQAALASSYRGSEQREPTDEAISVPVVCLTTMQPSRRRQRAWRRVLSTLSSGHALAVPSLRSAQHTLETLYTSRNIVGTADRWETNPRSAKGPRIRSAESHCPQPRLLLRESSRVPSRL